VSTCPHELSSIPKSPRPFLSFLEFFLNWWKSQNFDELHQFLKIMTEKIQTRHVRNQIEKENTTILLMDWKIIMFDHEGVKIAKVIFFSFHRLNLKSWSPKEYEGKGSYMHNPINLWVLKIYSRIFLNEFLMWFYLQDLLYLRPISKSLQYYGKSRLQWTPLYKILNRKIIINHFQNQIFDANKN